MTSESEGSRTKIGVISHDVGGAELISSYIREKQLDCLYCLDGLAYDIFSKKLGNISCVPLEELIEQSAWILCGTSSQSSLEWLALEMARACGKQSVSYLDHWVNYPRRFYRDGMLHLPDEIWVGDDIALNIAKNDFPNTLVKLVPNPIFREIRNKAQASIAPKKKNLTLLYLGEPIRAGGIAIHGDELYWGFSEEEALRYCLNNLHLFRGEIDQIIIRPHPKETAGKYLWALNEFSNLPIVIDSKCSLIDQIVASDIVAGCTTMAMVWALLAGKRVINVMPPEGTREPLPFSEIESLQDLIDIG